MTGKEQKIADELVKLGMDKGYAERIVPTYGNLIASRKKRTVRAVAVEIYNKEDGEWSRITGRKKQPLLAGGIPFILPLSISR